MTLPANIRVATQVPFPSQVKGSGVVAVSKKGGVWTISLNFETLPASVNVPNPLETYALVWDSTSGAFYRIPLSALTTQKVVQILDGTAGFASPYAALPNQDTLIVKQAVGAPFTITVDWSQRTKPLTIVDGKGDADVNNITITPDAGQTQMGQVNYSYVIDGKGGSITLNPRTDLVGAY